MALFLIATTGLYLAFKQSPKRALTVMGLSFVLCAPWLLRSHALSGKWLSPEYEAEVQGRFQGAAPNSALPVAAAHYFVGQARELPQNIATALLPWNETNAANRLGPLRAPLHFVTVAVVGALVLGGWMLSFRRDAAFAEWYFVAHLLMVCLFIAGVGYFMALFPFLMLYLARGMLWALASLKIAAPKARRVLLVGAALQLAVFVARDKVYFDAFGWPNSDEREARFAWVKTVVPAGQTVFWLGLPAYAWAPWRYFDSGRYALGDPGLYGDETMPATSFFTVPQPKCEFVAAPNNRRDWQNRLRRLKWRPVFRENPQVPGAVTLFARP